MQIRTSQLFGVRKENLTSLSEYGLPLPWSIISSPSTPTAEISLSEMRHQAGLLKHEVILGNGDVLELSRDDLVKTEAKSRAGLLIGSVRSKIFGIHRAPSPQAGRYKAQTAQCTGPGLSRATASFSKCMFLCSPTCNPTCNPRRCCFIYGVKTPSPELLVCPVSASVLTAQVLLFFSTVKTRWFFYLVLPGIIKQRWFTVSPFWSPIVSLILLHYILNYILDI